MDLSGGNLRITSQFAAKNPLYGTFTQYKDIYLVGTIVNGYLRNITDDYVNLDVGGQYVVILYDLLNNKLKAVNMPDSQITDTKLCYYLGAINMEDPALSRVRFRFNINGYNVKQRWYNKE